MFHFVLEITLFRRNNAQKSIQAPKIMKGICISIYIYTKLELLNKLIGNGIVTKNNLPYQVGGKIR